MQGRAFHSIVTVPPDRDLWGSWTSGFRYLEITTVPSGVRSLYKQHLERSPFHQPRRVLKTDPFKTRLVTKRVVRTDSVVSANWELVVLHHSGVQKPPTVGDRSYRLLLSCVLLQ